MSGQSPAPAAAVELASGVWLGHLLVSLLPSGCSRYSCLGLFVLVAKPPALNHLSEVQHRKLGFQTSIAA